MNTSDYFRAKEIVVTDISNLSKKEINTAMQEASRIFHSTTVGTYFHTHTPEEREALIALHTFKMNVKYIQG